MWLDRETEFDFDLNGNHTWMVSELGGPGLTSWLYPTRGCCRQLPTCKVGVTGREHGIWGRPLESNHCVSP